MLPRGALPFTLIGQPPFWLLSYLPSHQEHGRGEGRGRRPLGAEGSRVWWSGPGVGVGVVRKMLENISFPSPPARPARRPPSGPRPLGGAHGPLLPTRCRPPGGPLAAREVHLLFRPECWAEGRSGRPPEVFRPGPQTRQAATSRPKAAPQLAR